MTNTYLFDVDGTLTPARQKMTDQFYSFFSEWIRDKKVYFISGSDYEKLQEQVPKDILESVTGVFGCAGNTLHVNGESVFSNFWELPQRLIDVLEQELRISPYPQAYGNHIEERVGMINFSVVGRNAILDERKRYYTWDRRAGERRRIVERIKDEFDDIAAVLGGEISIDIYPAGWDKSQVLKTIPAGTYTFFGDRTDPGGNDFALAKILIDTGHTVYNVSSYEETWKILREF